LDPDLDLDYQKVADPVWTLTPNIKPFTMPMILQVFSWNFKAYFKKKMLIFNTIPVNIKVLIF
jgi:hypothetical protein